MEPRAHHIVIGIFALCVFAMGLGFVLWLSKTSIDREFAYYDVVFNEAVTGLSKGGFVQYNGIKVGEVVQLKLAPDDPSKVLARIRVDGVTPIRQDTHAKLGILGITGVSFIQLSGGSPTSQPLLPTKQNPVPIIIAEASALSKLLASGEDIVTSINDSLFRVGQLLSKENVEHVSATLEHIHQVTGMIADQRTNIGTVLEQLSAASIELKKTLSALHVMTTQTNTLMRDNAQNTLEATRKALDSIDQMAISTTALLDDNRAAISTFSNQGLRQIGPTLSELRETLRSLKQLTDELGDSSSSFLLGRDQPQEFESK